MTRKIFQAIEKIMPYAPPIGILGASFLNLTAFERQYLILILLIWVNVFILFKASVG